MVQKNGHGKSLKSHGISSPDLCGNPIRIFVNSSNVIHSVHLGKFITAAADHKKSNKYNFTYFFLKKKGFFH